MVRPSRVTWSNGARPKAFAINAVNINRSKIMKKLSLFAALCLALLPALLLLPVGCGTTAQKVYQSEGVVIHSVDVGMNLWRDYVMFGKATQAQVDAVKEGYTAYYTAQQIAKLAFERYLASKTPDNLEGIKTANAAVLNAETAVLNLINGYLKL
jgi:hypothetical protein